MVARHESQFELLRQEVRDTRVELGTEMRAGFTELREELSKVRRDMLNLTIGMIGAFALQFATLFAALVTDAI